MRNVHKYSILLLYFLPHLAYIYIKNTGDRHYLTYVGISTSIHIHHVPDVVKCFIRIFHTLYCYPT